MGLHLYPLTIRSVRPSIHCFLSRPTTEFRSLPTVIYFHGLNGTRNQIFQDRYLEFAEAIQELNCNLLAVELRCHGDRRENKELPAIQNMMKVVTNKELNPFHGALEDIEKTIDFVVEKQIARPGEIAVAGLAWGGMHVFYALRKDRRIRCGIALLPVCDITSMIEFRGLKGNPLIQQFEPMNFAENLAPRPLLIITGEKDTRTHPKYANELFLKLREEYREAEAEENLAYSMLIGVGHAYDSRMTDYTIYWLKNHLLVESIAPSF